MKIINEDKGRILKDPPQTLLLQKKVVQPFPNGQKVALYFCPTIKKYFSFVYGKEGIIAEEDFSIIEKLKSISEVESIHFNDGSSININEECASKILKLYDSAENKFEFEEYILESETNFLNALEYSVTKQTQEE